MHQMDPRELQGHLNLQRFQHLIMVLFQKYFQKNQNMLSVQQLMIFDYCLTNTNHFSKYEDEEWLF